MPGLFQTALENRQAYELPMNGVAFFLFQAKGTPIHAVGTRNLNSCSAVMVVSEEATIAAHIAPRPDNADLNDPNAGDKHVTQKMDELGKLYCKYQKHFSQNSSWVVTAICEGETTLPDQKEIIESKLQQWGIIHSDVPYQVVQPPLPDNGKGTVFIDGRQGGFPRVYVEDRLVNETSTASNQVTATISAGLSTQQIGRQSSGSGTSGGLALKDFQEVVFQHMKYKGTRGRMYEHKGQKLFAKDELWQRVRVGSREGYILQSKGLITYI